MRNKIFVFLIYIWSFLAFTFLIYNSLKFFHEFKEWGHLSDIQKRDKIFNGKYSQILFIRSFTQEKKPIYIYTKDGMMFLLSRYYLYPQKTHLLEEDDLNKIDQKNETFYLISFSSEMNGEFSLVASRSAEKIYIYKNK